MNRFFADTFYLAALLCRRDAWHDRVAAFSRSLAPTDMLLTTDAILVELLAALSTTRDKSEASAIRSLIPT